MIRIGRPYLEQASDLTAVVLVPALSSRTLSGTLKKSPTMERSNTTAQSALYGRPPITDNDYWIVKALLFEMKIADADPVQGLPFEHFPPLSDENRSGSIIAAVTISIFFIVAITATRLVARKTIRTSSLGWDDALISVAAVRQSSIHSIFAYPGSLRGLYSLVSSVRWSRTEQ